MVVNTKRLPKPSFMTIGPQGIKPVKVQPFRGRPTKAAETTRNWGWTQPPTPPKAIKSVAASIVKSLKPPKAKAAPLAVASSLAGALHTAFQTVDLIKAQKGQTDLEVRRRALAAQVEQYLLAAKPIPSSFIDAVEWWGLNTVVVTIMTQDYTYTQVPETVFNRFRMGLASCITNDTGPVQRMRWVKGKSPSLGAFYNRYIKGKYPCKRGAP